VNADVVDPQFAAVVAALEGSAGVTVGSGKRGFGPDALQVEGRIFAMLRGGRLVLKLPANAWPPCWPAVTERRSTLARANQCRSGS
jgi:hypothetical protein